MRYREKHDNSRVIIAERKRKREREDYAENKHILKIYARDIATFGSATEPVPIVSLCRFIIKSRATF